MARVAAPGLRNPPTNPEWRKLRRPTLRSQLNQIRLWLRQGRTEAWIAHKLDVSVGTLEQFKREHRLGAGEAEPEPQSSPVAPGGPEAPAGPASDGPEGPEAAAPAEPEGAEPDARQETLEADAAVGDSEAVAGPPVADELGSEEGDRDEDEEDESSEEDAGPPRRRRRGRRGGRRRRAKRPQYEATFEHGEDGYGLRLDPAVADNPVYAKHWAGQRTVAVTLDPDAITVRRVEEDQDQQEPRD